MLKPFGTNSEKALLDDYVNYMTLSATEEPAKDRELKKKLKYCDILQADVDFNVDETIFENAPNLKYVLCTTIGVDYVDLKAASKRNIIVANNPEFCVVAVAEYAMGLIYSIMRRIPEGAKAAGEGNWNKRDVMEQSELFGKTLGVIGFGKTGKDLVRQALGVGMNVHVRINDPDPHNKAHDIEKMGAIPMSFEEVLATSDVLSIHVPMLNNTNNLIDKKEFGIMKDGAYLINVARGGVVNEEALLENLKNGKLAGAALDVLVDEPPNANNKLLKYNGDNLIITPHVAWFTEEANRKNDAFLVQQVKDIINGNTPAGIVNK